MGTVVLEVPAAKAGQAFRTDEEIGDANACSWVQEARPPGRRSRIGTMQDDDDIISPGGYTDIGAFLDESALTEGQKRRIGLFQDVESGVCRRIEELCGAGALEVVDVAVLVVAEQAHEMFFGECPEPGTSVILGHREQVYELLRTALPPSADAPFDPYEDLLKPAPPRCVRVLIIDEDSLTVLSYGSFVVLAVDGPGAPRA